VELSLYVPVAVNCIVFPMPTVGDAGVTVMDCNVTEPAVTVRDHWDSRCCLALRNLRRSRGNTCGQSRRCANRSESRVRRFHVTLAVMVFVELSL